MGKKKHKKSGKHKAERLLLATAIINLLSAVIMALAELLD